MNLAEMERQLIEMEFSGGKDLCSCGSGKERRPLYDARGIFCCYICDDCEKDKMQRYRPEVLNDGNYQAEEPIEPET